MSEEVDFAAGARDCGVEEVSGKNLGVPVIGELDDDVFPLGSLALVNGDAECGLMGRKLSDGNEAWAGFSLWEEGYDGGLTGFVCEGDSDIAIAEVEGAIICGDEQGAAMRDDIVRVSACAEEDPASGFVGDSDLFVGAAKELKISKRFQRLGCLRRGGQRHGV